MSRAPGFHIITLGCPKNVVDSESMAALLHQGGLLEAEQPEKADVIIINTCCFIESAKEEAIRTILDAAQLKASTGASLVVTGCLPQRYKDEIANALPEVDSWMGLEDLGSIVDVVRETAVGGKLRKVYGSAPRTFEDLPRRYTGTVPYGYLKIAEGCSHRCAFCIIPCIRGAYRSLPMEAAERKAREMAAAGHREIILIAQDTTLYGMDLYGKPMLSELLKRLAGIDDIQWLRLMYAYPTTLTADILKTMASEPKICKYLDLPLQHSHPDVLAKMGRPAEEKYTRGVVEQIREIIPGAIIRTAFIVGHPGETDKRFEHLMNFVEDMEFYHMGVFTYSPEEGTPAAEAKTRPSRATAERRRDELMAVQQNIALRLRQDLTGKKIPAVCEFVLEQNGENRDDNVLLVHMESGEVKESSTAPPGTTAIGRTVYDAPEIDSILYITGEAPPVGTFFQAEITGSSVYDLEGQAK